MDKVVVTGIGTNVGKTVTAAIVTTLLQGDYWKPIQSGADTDSKTMERLIDLNKHKIHPSTYTLKSPLSPHAAASLESITIDSKTIIPPKTERPLIIETAGGICVPLTKSELAIDLFSSWTPHWILVSKNYLGSINHTLLSVAVLKLCGITPLIVFNGEPNPATEEVILKISRLPMLGRILPEATLNPNIIQKYAEKWKLQLLQ